MVLRRIAAIRPCRFAGIVTLEDVIEEIVGREIVGEFDPAVDMREQARQERQNLKRQNLTDSASE